MIPEICYRSIGLWKEEQISCGNFDSTKRKRIKMGNSPQIRF